MMIFEALWAYLHKKAKVLLEYPFIIYNFAGAIFYSTYSDFHPFDPFNQ